MCWSCVARYVAECGPVMVDAGHLAPGPLVRRLYATEWGTSGGPLHVVLDDTNVEAEFLQPEAVAESVWRWLPWSESPFTSDDYALVQDIAALLLALPTEADRALAIEMGHSQAAVLPVGTIVLADLVLASRWPR